MTKKTTEQFIEDAKNVHGDKYDYSLVEYVGSHSKIKIICKEHGVFEQSSTNHLSGGGCPICCNNVKLTTEEFIKRAKKLHGDKYDYSLVDYKNTGTKVKIICPIHGEFQQRPTGHLSGKECRKCGFIKTISHTKMSKDEFIEKAKKIHGDKYDYSKSEYINCDKKILIICPKHGEFKQSPYCHLVGYRCPTCKSSKGELKVKNFLDENNIKYIPQHFFPDCKYKNVLKFDFYLPYYNICIEYDGQQHFEPSFMNYYGKTLNENKKRDEIKNQYCLNNNIKLIRIKYDQNVNDYLSNLIGTENKLTGSSHRVDK